VKLLLAKPVWGEAYVDLLLDANLPSLLAEGNLPRIAREHDVFNVIFTTPEDAERIEQNPTWRRVTSCVPSRIEMIPSLEGANYDGAISQMTRVHQEILGRSEWTDRIWLFDLPDHVWGNGSLAHLAGLAASGVRHAAFAGLATVREDVLPQLEAFRSDDGTISVSPDNLTKIGLKSLHLHDITRCWRSAVNAVWPHHVSFRTRNGDRMLRHSFYIQPWIIALGASTARIGGSIDLDYLALAAPDPADILVISNTAAFSVLELSWRAFQTTGAQPPGLALSTLGAWIHAYADNHRRSLGARPMQYRTEPGQRLSHLGRLAKRVISAGYFIADLHALALRLRPTRPALAAFIERCLRNEALLRAVELPENPVVLLPPEDFVRKEWDRFVSTGDLLGLILLIQRHVVPLSMPGHSSATLLGTLRYLDRGEHTE
jgi:hypothetical protein